MFIDNEDRLSSILLSEFDIDTGACFRAYHPMAKSIERFLRVHEMQDHFANLMLPDGAEKVEVSSTVFLLNRVPQNPCYRFPVYTFVQKAEDSNWVPSRGSSVILPEVLHLDETDSSVSIRFHDQILHGPWPASQMRFEFLDSTPPVIAAFILMVQEDAKRDGESENGAEGAGEERKRATSEDLVFMEVVSASTHVGIVVRSTDLQSLFRSHHRLVECLTSPTSKGSGVVGAVQSPLEDSVEELALPADETTSYTQKNQPLFVLTAVVSKRDSSVRRGGVTKAVGAAGPSLGWLQSVFPILVECAQRCCDVKGTDEAAIESQTALLKECFECLQSVVVNIKTDYAQQIKLGSPLKSLVERYSTTNALMRNSQSKLMRTVSAFGTTVNLEIPLFPSINDITFQEYDIERLLLIFGAQFVELVHGILTGKKIIVLSREHTAFDVCQVVIVLGMIGSLLQPNFFHAKVYPYVSINETTFSEVPGYIVGTMNPIFENAKAWGWDLICDLDKGVVRASDETKRLASYGVPQTTISTANTIANAVGIGEAVEERQDLPYHAAVFLKDLLMAMEHMMVLRLPAQERCLRLRLIVEEYAHLLALIGATEGSERMGCVATPLRGRFFTPSARYLITQCHLASMTNCLAQGVLEPNENPSILLWCATMRRSKGLDTATLLRALDGLAALIRTEEDILLFLRRMPIALGGLSPVAMQLAHGSFDVRQRVYVILKRVDSSSPLGRAALSSMSSFALMLYENFDQNFGSDDLLVMNSAPR